MLLSKAQDHWHSVSGDEFLKAGCLPFVAVVSILVMCSCFVEFIKRVGEKR